MEWYDSLEDFKKRYDLVEEVNEEEFETYSGTHKINGVAYAPNLIIEFKGATTYSPEKCRNAWHIVYKTKIRESTVEKSGNNYIFLKHSDIYLRTDSIVAFYKSILDDKVVGVSVILSNGKEMEISCCEYWDLKSYLTGELECLN